LISSETQNVKTGEQSYIQVTVTNIGGTPTGLLSIALPTNNPQLVLVSSATIPSLNPEASTTITFLVTPPGNALPLIINNTFKRF
jgi:hypothetical protein